MSKGERSRLKILKDAMEFVSIYGLSNVTIGEISKMTKMSRTGVISHFKNKEDMQIAILRFSENEYRENVIKPSFHENPLTHLRQYLKNWMNWVEKMEFDRQASCPFLKAMLEYQDREDSTVKSHIQRQQKRLIQYITQIVQACVDQGFFKADLNPYDFAFKLYSFYVGHNAAKYLVGRDVANKRVTNAIEELIDQSLL